MAGKKLEYDVEVDASGAVADLKKLGEAGEKAGKQIGDGFKDVGSKSEAAFDKVIGNLKAVTDESKRTIETVGKIGDKFGEGFDPAATAKLVTSLRQAGVEFDTIEARADELATTMRELDSIRIEGPGAGLRNLGSDLDNTSGKIRNVGDELGHVRSESDQSRSVLANMAGNTAQDLGQLGGVVGSLGVGIGQLAEYAVDGNIALSNLAKTAGPLAAVAAAGFLIQDAFKNAAETKAFNVKQAQDYADAIDEVGDSMQAVVDIAQDGLEGRIRDESILGGLLDKEKTVDLIKLLDEAGLTLADVNDAIRSGAHDRTEFTDWLNGSSPEAAALRSQFDDLAGSGEQYTAVLEGVLSNTIAYTTATEDAEQKSRVLGSSLDTINEQLRLMRIDENPLSVLSEDAIKFGQVMVDPVQLWGQLVDDLRDGQADVFGTAMAIDAFAEAMHLTVPEVEALAIAQGEGVKASEEYLASAEATGAAFGKTATDGADAVKKLQDMSRALRLAGLNWDDAAERATAFAAALDEVNATSEIGLSQRIIDASEAWGTWGDAIEEAQQQGVDFAETDFIPDTWEEVQNMDKDVAPLVDAFATMRTQIQDELTEAFNVGGRPAFNEHLENIRRVATEKLRAAGIDGADEFRQAMQALGIDDVTIDALIRVTGEEEARSKIATILGAVNDIPPEILLQIQAEATVDPNQALADLVNYVENVLHVDVPVELEPGIDQTARTRTDHVLQGWEAGIAVPVATDEDQSVDETGTKLDEFGNPITTQVIVPKSDSLGQMQTLIDHVARPRTVPLNVKADNAGQVNRILDQVARDRTADIYVVTHNSTVTTGGGGGAVAVPNAAPNVAGFAATEEVGVNPLAGDSTGVAVSFGTPIGGSSSFAPTVHNHVTIQAAVIGSRFDVQRAVTKGIRDAQRLGGARTLVRS